MNWISCVISLPTENATVRQRAWRALKASGAAVLRDGVYLMPDRPACRAKLEAVAAEVREGGGTALVLRVEEPGGEDFASLFDRSADFAALQAELRQAAAALTAETTSESIKQVRKLRKGFAAVVDVDFFPGEAQKQVDSALRNLELAIARALSPDEPHSTPGDVPARAIAQHQGRVWATRRRPWVDRLASAWLIRRFIDPGARILWLASPADCPKDALGFDFDGAVFSHVGGRVTFEVLIESFGLKHAALARLGLIVHFLDEGGIQPPEAAGVESVLTGLRKTLLDDDQLLATASHVFDGLFAAFSQQGSPE